MPPLLEIHRQPATTSEPLVIQLAGKLSLETVHEFATQMRAEDAPRVILDMSRVTFLDSAGVGALVSMFVSRRNHSKTLALAGLTQQGNAVMQVSGLIKLLPIFPTVEAAAAQRA
jgi:anti-sigma B factor antagonist